MTLLFPFVKYLVYNYGYEKNFYEYESNISYKINKDMVSVMKDEIMEIVKSYGQDQHGYTCD
jgi:hypothetical protein